MHQPVNPLHLFNDPKLLKTFVAHVKRHLNNSETKRKGRRDIQILQNFQVFVSNSLERYCSDFQKEPDFQKDFYNRFWKTFFDELLIEARRLFDHHNFDVKDVSDLRSELQQIAEKGLDNFARLFKPFP